MSIFVPWCVCVCVSLYQEVCLTLNAPTFSVTMFLVDCCIIIYLTCLNVQESSSIYYFSYFFWRKKTEKRKDQMFTEEQRSWQLPGELIWVCLFLICFSIVSSIFVQQPEQQLLMGPLSRCCLDVVQTWSKWLLSPPLHLAQASWGAGLLRSLICLTR